MTVGVSEANADRVKAILAEAREQILALAQREEHPERVYQLNLHLFPVTKQIKRGHP